MTERIGWLPDVKWGKVVLARVSIERDTPQFYFLAPGYTDELGRTYYVARRQPKSNVHLQRDDALRWLDLNLTLEITALEERIEQAKVDRGRVNAQMGAVPL